MCNDIALLANDGGTQTLPTVSAIIVVLFYCFVDFSCNCLFEQNKTLMILISKVENLTTFPIILLSQKKHWKFSNCDYDHWDTRITEDC